MAKNSKIEWTTHTANLWHGCTKVHAGCDHCYAETLSHRWGRDIWGNDKPRMEVKSVWNDLKNFQREAAAAGTRDRVFVGSMMDIFEKPMPVIDNHFVEIQDHSAEEGGALITSKLRAELFQNIHAGMYPNLIFLFLTKRPGNIPKYIPKEWIEQCPDNVMFGTSVVDQETADKLIPQLMKAPGRKFLSMEPLIGPVKIDPYFFQRHPDRQKGSDWDYEGINWIIVGGESGNVSTIRPMHPDWVREIRDQCKEAGVPFFFKQWGEYAPHADREGVKKVSVSHGGIGYEMCRVGKHEAGAELDGVTHKEFPHWFEAK